MPDQHHPSIPHNPSTNLLAEVSLEATRSTWLTAAEAARHLNVKHRTLLLWVRQGKIPAHRLSGVSRRVWRFLRSELDAMLLMSSAGSADRRKQ